MSFPSLPNIEWIQIVLYFGLVLACVKPLGTHMANVYAGERTFLSPVFGKLESGFYTMAGIDPSQEMDWRRYALAVLMFSFLGIAALFAALCLQYLWGPDVSPTLAFDIAVSYVTNTNWQAYSGEQAMSLYTQMAGLAVQNFLSAAVGMAVMAAVVRGFTRAENKTVGNFWADLVRGILYILLPLSFVLTLILVSLGVVQTWYAFLDVPWLDPTAANAAAQKIALGPVASQVAIMELGSNGGGYFGANAAHPFENPSPLTNFIGLLAILLIPAAQFYMFGRATKDTRQGWVLLVAMTLIFVPMFLFTVGQEQRGNPLLTQLGVAHDDGNMEGKETRFGILDSALWATATTATSNGSVNAAMDSLTPLGDLVPMALMQLGEVIYGGVGSGLYGMLIFVLITVFIAGLMVGRTPEYLGKKIGVFDMKMAALAVLIPPLTVLLGTALAVTLNVGKTATLNPFAQGFSEILYAFTSATNNNGSSMGGLTANTPFFNIALALAMLIGRFGIIIPVLALAGSIGAKPILSLSAGTLRTATPTFILMLMTVILTSDILTFVPSLALGPLAEYFHESVLEKNPPFVNPLYNQNH